MTDELKEQLRGWVEIYHTPDFIVNDPVQFPHRYVSVPDIEIMGLLTAVLSFGNRRQILKKVNELDELMNHAPKDYVLSCAWENDFNESDRRSFYRMVSFAAFRVYFEKLYAVYTRYETLEDALLEFRGSPMEKLCAFLEVSARSPQKKLNMFLRWMVRQDSAVDFGIWKRMSAADLIIPLDTHVCRMACRLGLTDSTAFSLSNAKRITNALAELFPGDPCLGDFALFGYGVNHPD